MDYKVEPKLTDDKLPNNDSAPELASVTKSRYARFSWLGVLGLYFVLTLILTWPMVLNFGGAVPDGSPEDRFQNFWNFWWVGRALANFQNPFETNVLFYPYYTGGANPTVPLYLHTLQLLNCLVVLPITAIFGIAAAYNSLILFSFSLSGLGAYLLARHLTKNFWAGLLAGLVYTFSFSHFGSVQTSITNIMSIQWLPFYVLALHLWHERRNSKWIGLAALILAAAIYTDWYNTLYLVFYTAFFYIVTSWPRGWLRQLPGVIGAGLGGAILGAPALIGAFLTLNSPIFAAQFDLTRDIRASRALLDLLNPLQSDGAIFWAGLLIGLALLIKGGMWRGRGGYWLAFFLLVNVLTLGPRLQISGERGAVATDIPLPYALLKALPGVSVMRAPERFDIPGQLALAVLLALAVALIFRQSTIYNLQSTLGKGKLPSYNLISIILCIVMAVSYLVAVNPAPMKMAAVAPASFVNALPKGDYAILELPITRHYNFDHERMLNQTYHRHPIMGGYLARPVLSPYRTPESPFRYLAEQRNVQNDPNREIFPPSYSFALVDNLVRLYNFRYVVLYKNDYRFERERQGVKQLIEGRLGADALVMEDASYALYKVPDRLWQGKIDPALDLGDGWYEVEENAEGIYRWTQQRADFYVTAAQPTHIKLSVNFRAFGGDRPTRLLLNGEKVLWEGRLTPAPQTTEIELDVPVGTSRLTLESVTPAQTGKETGLSQDTRPLAFLVSNIKIS